MPSVSDILLIFSIAVAVYAVVMAVIFLFTAGRRSWVMALLRLVITVGSAIAAVPLARMAADILADYAYELLVPMLGTDIQELLTDLPAGAEGARVLAAMIVAPILFLIIFLVVRALLALILAIVSHFIPGMREPHMRGVAMPLGAVNGLAIVLITLVPLCGFLAMGGRIIGHFAAESVIYESKTVDGLLSDIDMTEEDLSALSEELEAHPVIKIVDGTVGNKIFEELTVSRLDASQTHGKTVDMGLESELDGLVGAALPVMAVMDSFDKADYTPADKQVLLDAADRILDSEWVGMLATDAVVCLSNDWLRGDEFVGMERPAMDANMNPVFNRLLLILSTETNETLQEDLHTLLDVLGDILAADLFTTDNFESDYVLQKIQDSGLLTTTLAKLEANPRLAALVTELKSLAMRLVTDMIGVDELKNGKYADQMDMVANELTGVLDMPEEERHAIIKDTLNNAMKDVEGMEDFEIPEDVAISMSDKMIEELGQDGVIDKDELTDYFIEHADESLDLLPDDLPDNLPDNLPEGIPDGIIP